MSAENTDTQSGRDSSRPYNEIGHNKLHSYSKFHIAVNSFGILCKFVLSN